MSRPYGWNRDGTLRDDEAAILKASATDVIDGRPVNQIVQELNAAGHRTSMGGPWAIGPLTRALRNPRITGRRLGRDGQYVPADVDPILTPDEWDRVLAVIDNPDRKRSAPRPDSLLTGLVRCQTCDVVMERRGMKFRCGTCATVVTPATGIETEVQARVLARLTTPVWRAAIAGAVAHRDTYDTEIAAARDRMVTLAETFGAGGIEQDALAAGVAAARTSITEAEAAAALAAATSPLDGLSDEELVQWWTDAAESTRRDIIRAVLDHVDVRPADEATSDDRLVYHWR